MIAAATVRPRRTALFTPATAAKMLQRAASTEADVLIVDLEDAIAPDRKETAREVARQALPALLASGKEIVVRVNSLGSAWIDADLEAVCEFAISGVLYPKVDSEEAVRAALSKLAACKGSRSISVWCMIETPLAVLNLAAIARCSAGQVRAWVVGTNDLAKDLRVKLTPSREYLLPVLAQILVAARSYDLCVLDGVYNVLHDLPGLEALCRQGAGMGFDGKTVIHPSQIEICNRIYSPSDAEIATARAIVDAFKDPANAGKGVLQIGGEMVELLHARSAQRTLDLATAIAASLRVTV